MSLSPASDASSPRQHSVDSNNANTSLSVSNTTPNSSNDTTTTSINDLQSQIPPSSGVKRKPNRRANTAERRATHNAVERQRRETLNGRFLVCPPFFSFSSSTRCNILCPRTLPHFYPTFPRFAVPLNLPLLILPSLIFKLPVVIASLHHVN